MTGLPGSIHRLDPTYAARAQAVRMQAYANPDTRCWRCGRTLAQHPRHRSGRPPTWQAGHKDARVGAPLFPEVSKCNQDANMRDTNTKRRRRDAPTPPPPPRRWSENPYR